MMILYWKPADSFAIRGTLASCSAVGTPLGISRGFSWAPAKFIIFNTKFILFYTKFIIFNNKLRGYWWDSRQTNVFSTVLLVSGSGDECFSDLFRFICMQVNLSTGTENCNTNAIFFRNVRLKKQTECWIAPEKWWFSFEKRRDSSEKRRDSFAIRGMVLDAYKVNYTLKWWILYKKWWIFFN